MAPTGPVEHWCKREGMGRINKMGMEAMIQIEQIYDEKRASRAKWSVFSNIC
jgi:hypothetical protein